MGTYALMTITIPLWQCLPWAQYNHIGAVPLTRKEYVGAITSLAETGRKPELIPVMLEFRSDGSQGLSNVDWVTVWFFAAN